MAKQLVFGDEARRYLKNGVDAVANAVATTLGPKGRNVALDRKYGSPTITHDGVTVAKEIELEDPYENMGAQLLKEAATKTNDIAGDGTTTSTVLAIGPGDRDEDGNRIKMDVEVGDVVLFAKYSGTEIKYDGKKLLIMRESDILAIL